MKKISLMICMLFVNVFSMDQDFDCASANDYFTGSIDGYNESFMDLEIDNSIESKPNQESCRYLSADIVESRESDEGYGLVTIAFSEEFKDFAQNMPQKYKCDFLGCDFEVGQELIDLLEFHKHWHKLAKLNKKFKKNN